MATTYYTWAQFVQMVKDRTPINAARKGVGQTTYLTSLIRDGVIQLQTIIDEFRCGHESLYHKSDFAQEGCALIAVKPPESVIRDMWYVRVNPDGSPCCAEDGPCKRFAVRMVDWSHRFDMVAGKEPLNDQRAACAVDPYGYTFYLCPAPCDDECFVLSMFWDGLKLDFADGDQTPFTEAMAGAVVHYVDAQIALKVEHDQMTYQAAMMEFNRMKPLLYVRSKEQRAVANQV